MTVETITNDVLSDLRRTDLTAEASSEVCAAIRYYAHKPWWFTETQTNITTSASVESYPLPADFASETYLEIQRSNGEYYELYHMHLNDLRRKNEGINTNGYPENYTIYAKNLSLAFIPDQEYVVRMYYDRTYSTLSASASNVFTTELAPLIRARAAEKVALTKMHDTEKGAIFSQVKMSEYSELRNKHNQYVASGKVRAWR